MKIKIKKLNENAIVPKYQTQFSAGADIYALNGGVIEPKQMVKFATGIALEIPEGYAGFVFARSGLATKQGLAPSNKVGVIDSDYRGELMVSLYNHSDESRTINQGDRIAQLVIMPVAFAEFVEAEEIDETARGTGGFGSTGKN